MQAGFELSAAQLLPCDFLSLCNPLLLAGTPDAACNSGLNFCLNVTAANVICKYFFRSTSFTCRNGPPATQCPGNSALCPPADPQVPIVGLTVGVNGLCNDNVHNTILASVQGQLVTNAGAVGGSVKGEKTTCINVSAVGVTVFCACWLHCWCAQQHHFGRMLGSLQDIPVQDCSRQQRGYLSCTTMPCSAITIASSQMTGNSTLWVLYFS
jgi:hypothetical protein